MKLPRPSLILPLLALAALLTGASARVVFELGDFPVANFRNSQESLASCGSAEPSFLCAYQEESLTRIPTKGADFFFTPAGEIAAAFVKVQRGQTLSNYNFNDRANVIPFGSAIPAAALLLDGEYHLPQDVRGDWSRRDADHMVGSFSYTAGGYLVERTVVVSNVSETTEHEIRVSRQAGAADDGAVLVQLATPGIANIANPVVKIGFGQDFALNPAERAYLNPSYAALQKNDSNRDEALILLPGRSAAEAASTELQATFLRPNRIALQTSLAAGAGASATIEARLYSGRNELVRYVQEDYLGLPGLFRPNILGRLSLAVVAALQYIHQFVPSWGLSIIVLTLLFRVLVWPLITTQTRSMFGMQRLQPKMQELQRKHKDDREKLTQETMKLYREAGVNPAGGCLPILLQMPLFIILWRVFVNFEFAEGFLWLPDLGQPDPIYILPILYVLVMIAVSYFSARNNPTMLRQSMIINLVFVFIIVGFPAGVLVYYVVSMLVQVFQYWLISRGQPPLPTVVPAGAGKRGK